MSKSSENILKWKERIQQQKDSGLSIKNWCEQNQLPRQSYFYWRKKISTQLLNRASFTELTDIDTSGIFIEYRSIRIHLDKTFDASILKRCLMTLKETPC